MNEKQFYLGDGDDRVLLAFNFNVMREIQSVYKSIGSWADKLDPKKGKNDHDGEPDMEAFIKGFTFMLNEGVDIENEKADKDKQKAPFTEKQVGRLIGKFGKDEITTAMQKAIVGSTDSGDKDSKNE